MKCLWPKGFMIVPCVLIIFTLLLQPARNQPLVEKQEKFCLLRETYWPYRNWDHWIGFYCYLYTDPNRLWTKYNTSQFQFGSDLLPFILTSDKEVIFFNYTDSDSIEFIQSLFKTETFFKSYIICNQEGIKCCADEMTNTNIVPTNESCPTVWDGWSCFPQTNVNTLANLKCSIQAYQSPDHVCTLESEKDCFFNTTTQLAQWNISTNYAPCSIAKVYERRHEFHVYVLYASTFLCLPAIIIFFAFAKFRAETRVILHRNLLIAIVVRNILTIVTKYLIILDALKGANDTNNVMVDNGAGCRVLASFENAAKNAIYATMLVDGFYLHKLIVRSFAKEPPIWMLYSVIGVLSLLPTLIWAITMYLNDRENCWTVDNGEQWIVDGIRIAVLAINTILLIDIIRILISKMNQRDPTRQTKATLRATLFLIPLFGINILVTAKKIVVDDTCYSEDIYNYIRYAIEGLQGFMVALLFCYINSEVHKEFNNAFRKLKIFFEQKFGFSYRKASVASNSRWTTATFVGNQQ